MEVSLGHERALNSLSVNYGKLYYLQTIDGMEVEAFLPVADFA
jgi:hypothetical protein